MIPKVVALECLETMYDVYNVRFIVSSFINCFILEHEKMATFA